MKQLSIDNALELYKLLAPYIPDANENDTTISFVGKIISAIRISENYSVYTDAIALMMDVSVDALLENSTPEETVQLFTEGLSVNKIIDLKNFAESLGWQTKIL
jgi:hypothetical protein